VNERGLVAAILSDMGVNLLNPAPQIAAMIVDAAHFKRMLRANPANKRRKAYDELAPHLKFPVPEYAHLFESPKQRQKRLCLKNSLTQQ
jgi:hypothetical protein